MKPLFVAAAAVLVAGLGYLLWPVSEIPAPGQVSADVSATPLVKVLVPATFSPNAQIGKRAFEATCAACHGANAAGQDDVAPPLVHKIYEPSHHGDEAFQRAAAQGVRAHHWPFGDMPPVEDVSRTDVGMIIAYIRELQQANGIN